MKKVLLSIVYLSIITIVSAQHNKTIKGYELGKILSDNDVFEYPMSLGGVDGFLQIECDKSDKIIELDWSTRTHKMTVITTSHLQKKEFDIWIGAVANYYNLPISNHKYWDFFHPLFEDIDIKVNSYSEEHPNMDYHMKFNYPYGNRLYIIYCAVTRDSKSNSYINKPPSRYTFSFRIIDISDQIKKVNDAYTDF